MPNRSIDIILFADTNGGPVPENRYVEAIAGLRAVEKEVKSVTGPFNIEIYEAGYPLAPADEPILYADTTNYPETMRAQMVVGMTGRMLIDPKVGGEEIQTMEVSSQANGFSVVSDYTEPGVPEVTAGEYATLHAHGATHVFLGDEHCMLEGCIQHSRVEHPTEPDTEGYFMINIPTGDSYDKVKLSQSFCNNTKAKLRAGAAEFLISAEARLLQTTVEDFPELI